MRIKMRVATSEMAVITSDNPRNENPEEIIRQILGGVDASNCETYVEPDRAEAIRWALDQAEPGDCVLVAGKGHETEQIVGNRRLPFIDREVIRDCLMKSLQEKPARVGA